VSFLFLGKGSIMPAVSKTAPKKSSARTHAKKNKPVNHRNNDQIFGQIIGSATTRPDFRRNKKDVETI